MSVSMGKELILGFGGLIEELLENMDIIVLIDKNRIFFSALSVTGHQIPLPNYTLPW